MKTIKLLIALLLLGAAGTGSAWAHGGNVHFGVAIGVPLWGPWYYPPPYAYDYYSPVVVQSSPPVYIQEQAAPAAAPANDWYYCAAARGYYPYVKDCPGGWQRVSPRPPGQP